VIEVGAHEGGSTALLSALALKVYTFEPDNRFFQSIKRVSKANKNVEAWNLACGSARGKAFLYQVEDRKRDVSSIPRIRSANYTRKQKTNVVALDDISFGLKPTAIILDCEGSELEVLKGAKRILSSAKTVLVETHYLSDGHPTLDDCRKEIESIDRFEIDTTVDDDGVPWLLCAARESRDSTDVGEAVT